MATQTIYASINADGSIKSQSGQIRSVSNPSSSSVYDIQFETPFINFPCAVVTQNYPDWDESGSSGGKTTDNAVIVSLDVNGVRIKTGGGEGDHVDRNFCIMVMGTVADV